MQATHPEVIFLAEAFTRPKVMKALAKAGFTQSYTYFTWRNTKYELTEYLTELTQTPMREYFRPNFFTNTPDILAPVLQTGGRAAFKMRLVLAATLSPSYGIYSGFELCENEAVPGTEEYLNSEKYEIKVRDWNQPGNIKEFIARVNSIRRENPALQEFLNLRFLTTDNDQILFYSKATQDKEQCHSGRGQSRSIQPHYCTAMVPPEVVGVGSGQELSSHRSAHWRELRLVRAQLRAARSRRRAGAHPARRRTPLMPHVPKIAAGNVRRPIRSGTRTRFSTSCASVPSTTATATGSAIFPV